MLLTSSWIADCLIISSTLALLLYKYFTRHFDYWKKRGVYFPKPIPFFGNFYDVAIFKVTTQELLQKYCNETDDPYFGIFIFDEPALVIKSAKLIKDVLIKDFSVFCDRRVATPKHPDMADSIFFLKYLPWKRMRTRLSPLFTSIMLKTIHKDLVQVNELMTDYLNKNAGIIDGSVIAGHFAVEMIARCFFGVNPHCFDEDISLFRKFIKKSFDFSFRNAFIQIMYFVKPSLILFFNLNFISADVIRFLKGIFKDALKSRASYTGKPRDIMDVTNQPFQEKQEGHTDVLDSDMAAANAILFLLAGHDTTRTIFSYTLYELAKNQNAQDKLREELLANMNKYGEMSFEGIQENKYLEMCVNEAMRMYPNLPFNDRVAMSDYRFEGSNLLIEQGTTVIIPTYAVQRDERYFPNGDKFVPERFADDDINKDGLSYLPFGGGPRTCIGKRLGSLAIRMGVANIVLKFKIEKCDRTPEKIKFAPKNFTLTSKVGVPLKITPIVKNLQ